MNLGTARTEFQARGFDYLSSTRCNAYLNRALAALSMEAPWPWLETSASGTSPITISDLRAVQSVVDTNTLAVLEPADRRSLVDNYSVLTTTGSPWFWYRDTLTSIRTYPVSSDTITVQYIAHEAELTSDSSSPLLPSRHHNVWVDHAVYEAYCDSDNWEAAAAIKSKIDGEVIELKRTYLVPNFDQPYTIERREVHEGF